MSVVSRQSAFWAVMALGLNTFVQSPGSGFVRDERFARTARLSPIYCFLDTLCIIVSIILFYTKTSSIKKSIGLAARFRGMIEGPGVAGHVDPPKLERTWWFRLSIFVFGALPQAVKLLGMRRIPLTQFWGLAYFANFLVLEGLQFLAQRVYEEDPDSNLHCDSLKQIVARFPVDASMRSYGFLLPWVTVQTLATITGVTRYARIESQGTESVQLPCNMLIFMYTVSLVLAFGCGSSCYSSLGGGIKWISDRFLHSVRSGPASSSTSRIFLWMLGLNTYALLLLCGYVSYLLYAFTPFLEPLLIPLGLDPWAFKWRRAGTTSAMVFYTLALTFNYGTVLRVLFTTLFDLEKETQPDTIYVVITTANIAAMLTYYTSIYNPVDTYKPSWTELLG